MPLAGDRPAARPLADEAETEAARATVESLLGPDPVTVDELARTGELGTAATATGPAWSSSWRAGSSVIPGQKVALALGPAQPNEGLGRLGRINRRFAHGGENWDVTVLTPNTWAWTF